MSRKGAISDVSSASIWLRTRPAIVGAGMLVAGIFAHDAVWHVPLVWIALALGLLALSNQLPRNDWLSCACIAISIGLAGAAAGQIASFYYNRNDICAFTSEEARLACIELQLTDTPKLAESAGPFHSSDRQMGKADVTAIRTLKGWEPASGHVTFSVADSEPRPLAGQRIRVTGLLEREAPAMNPGQFDAREFYRRQRILAAVHVRHGWNVEIVSSSSMARFAAARERVRAWLCAGFSPHHEVDRELLTALILGDRGPALRPVEDDFNATGASHLLASSGLRVTILGTCLYLVCRLLRFRPRVTVSVTITLVVALGFIMLPAPQAVRPIIVCAMLSAGLMLRRSIDSVQSLAMGAIAMLVCHPLDLYSAGFQLGFVTVLGILVMTPPLVRFIESRRNPDGKVLAKVGRQTTAAWLREKFVREMIQLSAVGLVAWLVSMPLVAYHFEQFNPWAVPIGIILSPFVFLALAFGFLKIALTALIPGSAAACAVLSELPLWIIRHGIHWMAKLPFADVPTPAPAVVSILLFYAFLVALWLAPKLPWKTMRLRWCAQCGLAGACVMIVLSPLLVGFARDSAPGGRTRLTLLSVGAGQCAIIEMPNGSAVVVDAGSLTIQDPLRVCVAPFLRHEGRSHIDSIYLSHGDYDHIGAAGMMVDEYHVHQVLTSPHFRTHADESGPCKHLLAMLDATHRSPREIIAGADMELGSGAAVQVLWPPRDSTFNSNNTGLVLRLTYGGRSILFPADIQEPAERELLKHPERLKSDILIAPHHGSSESTTDAFVRAVDPRIILSSNAAKLSKKQRVFDEIVKDRPAYRTSRCGAITVEIERSGCVKVEPFLKSAESRTLPAK